MKKAVMLISIALVLSISTLLLLFFASGMLKDRHNSFLRSFPPHPVLEGESIELGYNSYYFAGATASAVYLGNYKAPFHAIIVHLPECDTQHVNLFREHFRNIPFRDVRIRMDSLHFYVTDGTVPVIYQGSLDSSEVQRISDSVYFSDLVHMGNQSFAVRSLSGRTGENILGKITSAPPHQIFTDSILQKQQDGVFCTDGMLRYNTQTNQLIYLYHYRNGWMVMDSSLNLIYRSHTIDTVSIARIKTSATGNTHLLASPPRFVNKTFDVSNNLMLVSSNLMARNESEKDFNNNTVIDVYTLHDGNYAFSFYLYPNNKTNVKDFRLINNTLYVLYEQSLKIYTLRPEAFGSTSGQSKNSVRTE